MPTSSQITHELVNDLPVLMHLLRDELRLDHWLDTAWPRHGNWQGVSLGQVLVTWLAHIVSERNHFMSHVQDWANSVPHTLATLLGQSVRTTDFTDDRLAEVVRVVSLNEVWHPLEQMLTRQMVRVYDLTPERVRLDSTTASVYGGDEAVSVLFQRGHSKDHRPDLRQLKVMLAALDPLGVLVGVDVVSGDRADDGLYIPLITRLQTTLPASGLLYIGDCKMGALATRAYVQGTQNYYLMPLAQVGQVPAQLTEWVAAAVSGQVKLTPVRDDDRKTVLGEGYEVTRRLSGDGPTGRVHWTERVLIVRSTAYAQAAQRGLRQRLERTRADLLALTPPRGRGQRQFTDEAALRTAATALLTRDDVTGLLRFRVRREVERHPVRAYRGRPARTQERHRYVLSVQENSLAIQAQERLLGWRAYATNTSRTHLPLPQAVQAYRDEWLVERDCARLKGRSLSLAPLWVSREDHALGLTRVLTLAARLLALAEYRVRRKLLEQKCSLAGLYPGQPTRVTQQPTTERLLKAFDRIILTTIQTGKRVQRYLSPLSKLQQTILRDLECPRDLYQRLADHSRKPLRI